MKELHKNRKILRTHDSKKVAKYENENTANIEKESKLYTKKRTESRNRETIK